jgi:5'-3' exonuclease
MGLDNFLGFIRNKFPQVIKYKHVTEYSHNIIYLDIASYIYKAVCMYGNQNSNWLQVIIQLITSLESKNVHIITIFDGKPPEAKRDEIAERKEKRKKLNSKIDMIKDCISKHQSQDLNLSEEEYNTIREILNKREEKTNNFKLKKLLSFSQPKSQNETYCRNLSNDDIAMLEDYIETIKRQMIYVSDRERNLVKELLDVLGLPYEDAPEEAEAYCCFMLKSGIGNAVISCDTDCLAHGAKEVILNYDYKTDTCMSINLEDMLTQMNFTFDQFLDYAILIGCDYNKKNKLPKVGPVKAYELIKKYGCIDNIKEYDISILKHQEIRELFKPVYPLKEENLFKKQEVDEDVLSNFIDEHNLKIFNINQLIKKLNKKEIEIEFTDSS